MIDQQRDTEPIKFIPLVRDENVDNLAVLSTKYETSTCQRKTLVEMALWQPLYSSDSSSGEIN